MALVIAYASAIAIKKAHEHRKARALEEDEPEWGNFEPMDWDELSERDRLKKISPNGVLSPPQTPSSIIDLDEHTGSKTPPKKNYPAKLWRLSRRWSDPGSHPDPDTEKPEGDAAAGKTNKPHATAGHERTQSADEPRSRKNPAPEPIVDAALPMGKQAAKPPISSSTSSSSSSLPKRRPPKHLQLQQQQPHREKPLPILPDTPPPTERLPYPVIIPQRRPESNDRGFLYAYAPIMNDSGIDEDTFVDFLFHLNEACKISAKFDVVNASIIAEDMKAAQPTQMYGAATAISARATKSNNSQEEVNRYLAKSNETLFKPNGLFCLIVKYQPDEQMTIAQNALRSGRSLVKTKALERLGMLEDISDGDRLIATIPPSAPLIFPPPPSKDNDKGLKRAVTRRHDRKAQENYVVQMLNSGGPGKFVNPQLAVLYGRHDLLQDTRPPTNTHGEDVRGSKRFVIGSTRRTQSPTAGTSIRESSRRDTIRSEPTIGQGVVLYLMVINMPSRSEINLYNQETSATCAAPNFF